MNRVRSFSLVLIATLYACGGGQDAHPSGAVAHPSGAHENHRFDDPDYWVDVFENPDRDHWQMPTHVVGLMAVEEGMTIADIGAGTGYFEPYLGMAVGEDGLVLALDIEPSLVGFMQGRTNEPGWGPVVPRLIAPDDPAIAGEAVDRILIVDTWHHISNRESYARLLFDSLNPRGQLYIVDFEPDSELGPPRDHKLAAEVVVQELEAAGFQAEIIDEELPEQYIVVGTLSP